MYSPLPDSLTIRESDIHGLGLFATKNIPEGTNLGVAHIKIPHSEDLFSLEFCRTPLGGFYNHSETPNCTIKSTLRYFVNPKSNKRLTTIIAELYTIQNITKGSELTCKYTLYEVKNAN